MQGHELMMPDSLTDTVVNRDANVSRARLRGKAVSGGCYPVTTSAVILPLRVRQKDHSLRYILKKN